MADIEKTFQTPPTTFDDLVAPFPGAIRQTARALRDLVRGVMPEARETVSGGSTVAHAFYSLSGPSNIVCVIQPGTAHCKLYVHRVQPSDIAGLKLEGSGKNSRHVTVMSPAEAVSAPLREALVRARHLAGGQ